jgi:hypothetical protein
LNQKVVTQIGLGYPIEMQGCFRMSEVTRYEYFRVLAERYLREETKKARGRIIDEACTNKGLNGKSVIRAIWRNVEPVSSTVRVGRPRKYSEGAIFALKRLYRESDFQCSGKLHSMIPILRDMAIFVRWEKH